MAEQQELGVHLPKNAQFNDCHGGSSAVPHAAQQHLGCWFLYKFSAVLQDRARAGAAHTHTQPPLKA